MSFKSGCTGTFGVLFALFLIFIVGPVLYTAFMAWYTFQNPEILRGP